MEQIATTAIKQVYENMEDPKTSLPLSDNEITQIFNHTTKLLAEQPTVLTLKGYYTIIGDVHGSIETLFRIFDENGDPNQHPYIFLGDYIDRSPHGIEVLLVLFSLMILYPDRVFLIRGNHECPAMTSGYGFAEECKSRGAPKSYVAALQAFDQLPIAAVLNDQIFLVHGGISSQIKSRAELFALEKPRLYNPGVDAKEINISQAVLDLLWSDPSVNAHGFNPSPRGCGQVFGYDVLQQFLVDIQCALVVRSHEACPNGYLYPFPDKRLLTVFSAVDYCGLSNWGAYLVFTERGAQLKSLKPIKTNKKRWIISEAILDKISQIPRYIDA